MHVFEAVESRIACRWFLDQPVDQNIIRELIARAARAASSGNLQPWQVHALTGAPLAELKRRAAAAVADRNPRTFPTEYPIFPEPLAEPYAGRREHHGVQMYGALGIARDEHARRLEQHKRNYMFFNAPVGLFITIDRRMGPGQWADLGGYLNALTILARGYGLDTCPQVAWIRLHQLVTEYLGLPPEQMLYCGVAVGYGDHAHPVNSFRSPRASLEEFCKFYGFDQA